MAPLAVSEALNSKVVSDPSVMGGEPVVRGTRILAMTIVSYLNCGATSEEIFRDYPSLPVDSIEAVRQWAKQVHGSGRKSDSPLTVAE